MTMTELWSLVIILTPAAPAIACDLFRLSRYGLRCASLERLAAAGPGVRLVDRDRSRVVLGITAGNPTHKSVVLLRNPDRPTA